jgi:hypothetical protein
MKADLSKEMLNAYFETKNCKVKLQLSNGQVTVGYIMGYFYDEIEKGTVWQWHLVDKQENTENNKDDFGFYLLAKDIESFSFL